MSGFPSWWLTVGDFVTGSGPEVTTEIGVVLKVAEPGIIQVRWGTDSHASWYNMTEFARVRTR